MEHASVLITGASGFVGTHLCAALSAHGWRVLAAVRQTQAVPDALGATQVHLPLLSEDPRWSSALGSVQCVVHLAAHVHVLSAGRAAAGAFHEVNVRGTQLLAERAAKAGVRRFVFLSSIKVNGEGGSLVRYRADDIPKPLDCYARSKLEAEDLLRDFCRRAEMELVIIRPPLVYGPGVRANFRRLLQLASLGLPLPLRSIDNRRSFIGIWNLVNFIEVCLTHPDAAGETWLISDDQDLSTPELMRELARLMHKPARLFAVSPRVLRGIARIVGMGAEMSRLCDSLIIDTGPAAHRLGWKPALDVATGLARTVTAYRAARNR